MVYFVNVEELINKAEMNYLKALELLESMDYYDAAEKAWLVVENLRKAFLVAIGVPYEKSKSINYSLPLFSKLMRALGYQDLLKDYEWFSYKLHFMGFYENVTFAEEIIRIVREDVKRWMNVMKKVINRVRKIDISEVLSKYEEAIKIKKELISKSVELAKINEEVNALLKKLLPQNSKKDY